MNFIAIDTSVSVLRLAIEINGKKFYSDYDDGMQHLENIIPMIDSALKDMGESKRDIECVAVCTGPGSFTGLRIGVVTALGLSLAGGLKKIGFNIFEVYKFILHARGGLLIPLVDGKKNSFFISFIGSDGVIRMEDVGKEVIAERIRMSGADKVTFAGKDFLMIRDFISENIDSSINVEFCCSSGYTAAEMASYVRHLIENGNFSDDIEPIYLRKSEAEIALLNKSGLNAKK